MIGFSTLQRLQTLVTVGSIMDTTVAKSRQDLVTEFCPACGWRGFTFAFGDVQEDKAVEYYVCDRCGLGRKFPHPKLEQVKAYYQNGSWQHSIARPKICLENAAKFIVDAMRPHAFRVGKPAVASAIDIGAKGSELLDAIEAQGLAIEKKSMLDASPKATTVESGWLGDGNDPSGVFELVTATYILEHAHNLRDFLRDLANYVAPNGWLYIEVPSMELGAADVGHADDINRNHLWHFTITALSHLPKYVMLGIFQIVGLERAAFPGWPVNRLLLRKGLLSDDARSQLTQLRTRMEVEYGHAASKLQQLDPKTNVLYAASGSYERLMREHMKEMLPFRIFDKYKHGREIFSKTIENPDMIDESITNIWICTRFWNSFVEIRQELMEKFPDKEIWHPFRNGYPIWKKDGSV